MKIYLIRHTKPDVQEGVCYGQSDLNVWNTFESEINDLKKRLKVDAPVELWSSPLIRCRKMADRLAPELPLIGEVNEDNRLKEVNFGDWEMKTWEQITKPVLQRFRENLATNQPPNGESFEQLKGRVSDFLEEKIATGENDLLITAHAGVIRAAISWAVGFSMSQLFHIHVDYAGITLLETHRDQVKLVYLNR